MTAIAGWENFYVIVGSSAGALIGLQFVVLTLLTRMPVDRGDPQLAGAAFATPSVVHFGVVLFLSALLSAPWNRIAIVAALWCLTGICGVAYVVIVAKRMRVQTFYRPVLEDWLFHAVLPFGAYAMLTLSAGLAYADFHRALFLVAASSVLLLFIGIHNAWDAVTYHVFSRQRHREE
jgi:hypothetical protein